MRESESSGTDGRSSGSQLPDMAGGARSGRRWRPGYADARPPWWPPQEEWPPRGRHEWRRVMRHRPFARRFGCMFFFASLFGMALFLGITGLVLRGLHVAEFNLVPVQVVYVATALFLAFVIVSVTTVWLSIRRTTRPLDQLVEASDKVAEGDYSARMSEAGPPEIGSMARAFNSMASRLQSHEQQRSAMLADVAHELRTPLTVVKGLLEGLIDGMYPADEPHLKSMLEEVDLLSRLVDDMRMLAAAETTGLDLRKEQTDLTGLVGETSAAFRTYAETAGVHIELTGETRSIVLNVDGERIRQVITNLLSNALRHSTRGGVIGVGISTVGQTDAQKAEVWVTDSGTGIAPEDVPHVFDRYYKSADSRGAGIGLSIAKSIVEAHGGTIGATSSGGHGTTIRFSLPF